MNRNQVADRIAGWILKTISTEDHFRERRKIEKAGKAVRGRQIDIPFEAGDLVRFRCQTCSQGGTFEYDGNPVTFPKYCSKTCKSTAWKKSVRYRETPEKCPHPHKTSFFSGEVAEKYLRTLRESSESFYMTHAYVCKCGRYHLGRVQYEK